MVYFKLEELVRFYCYFFDFYSYFVGILLVESNSCWMCDCWVFCVGEWQVSLEKGQELFLIGLLMSVCGVVLEVDGKVLEEVCQVVYYELFELVLQWMVRCNLFVVIDCQGYLCGECVVENIYFVCFILV